jgi:hypothetical protein
MRLVVSVSCLLMMVGCVGPHSTGALWAQQNLEQELILGRQTEAERLGKLHAYELSLADEALASERARLGTALQDCPGMARQTLQLSPGDRTRDSIRLRIGDDALRNTAVAQVALADWRLRRAQATGDGRFCDDARQALNGSQIVKPTIPDRLAQLGSATVTRDPQHSGVPAEQTATELSLSHYALGYTDTVRARAPLPQYLAAVYGGSLLDVDPAPSLNVWVPGDQAFTPEMAVDLLAPVYPQWEPDALYSALLPQR